ncbi:MAG: hypothetical protein ACK5TW_00065 [Cyanobacteriota bacterium]|jgi:hypothetical protein
MNCKSTFLTGINNVNAEDGGDGRTESQLVDGCEETKSEVFAYFGMLAILEVRPAPLKIYSSEV